MYETERGRMKQYTIIWDFDGTLLPLCPYDSEQSLLMHKIDQLRQKNLLLKQIVARAIIYADKKEWLGRFFKRYYLWVLKETRMDLLDKVARTLAKQILEADRETLLQLWEQGYRMVVVSCGTLDLSMRILRFACIEHCFTTIMGNPFKIENDLITGMEFNILTPEDKLSFLNSMGISPERSMVVGDGYTDIPLLDLAKIPVMMDRTGRKKNRYKNKKYHFISSIPETLALTEKYGAKI